jgi:peptidoglycan/xylan/chitin deacetylase (PgdA/CDA1 family)
MISATPAAFEEQLRLLVDNYRIVSLAEVLEAQVRGRELPSAQSVLITFDDGYRDFGEIAWPLLRRYRAPATLFVATGYPGRPNAAFWWDRLYRAVIQSSADGDTGRLRSMLKAAKALPHAQAMALVDSLCNDTAAEAAPRSIHTWDELRALAKDGVTLAPHSQSHALLTRLPPDGVREEVRGSIEDLRREIGSAPTAFCYPGGAHDETAVGILKEVGVAAAFTTLDGHNRVPSTDPLRLRRTNMTPRTTPRILRLRLQPWAPYVDRIRHAVS